MSTVRTATIVFFCIVWFSKSELAAQIHGSLEKGPNAVGFKVIDAVDESKRPLRICLWYPAASNGPVMHLSDYVEIPSLGGAQSKPALRSDLRSTLELVYDQPSGSVSLKQFDSALQITMWATRDAPMIAGKKYPLIINDAEPSSMVNTNEWLASHGFIVAVPGIQYPPPADENSQFTEATLGLERVFNFMLKEQYVDTSRISGLGFGGGSFAPFYLAMKFPQIKSLASIEGGLFMPISKTTVSSYYHPERFHIPMLHVVSSHITSNESTAEFNAIKSPKYRLIETAQFRHHDLILFGAIMNGILHFQGGQSKKAMEVYSELCKLVLEFSLKEYIDQQAIKNSSSFSLKIFN